MTKQLWFTTIFSSLLLLSPVHASAELIVDTGVPTSWPDAAGDPILDSGQWLAGRFSVAEAYRISTIEGYMASATNGGTFSVSIYSNGGDVPGSLLYLTGAMASPVAFDNSGNAVPEWFGASGLDWLLVPGNYWVAFEVRVGC